jgi:hypothetical protein
LCMPCIVPVCDLCEEGCWPVSVACSINLALLYQAVYPPSCIPFLPSCDYSLVCAQLTLAFLTFLLHVWPAAEPDCHAFCSLG